MGSIGVRDLVKYYHDVNKKKPPNFETPNEFKISFLMN